jgi:hypothetical protein
VAPVNPQAASNYYYENEAEGPENSAFHVGPFTLRPASFYLEQGEEAHVEVTFADSAEHNLPIGYRNTTTYFYIKKKETLLLYAYAHKSSNAIVVLFIFQFYHHEKNCEQVHRAGFSDRV